MATLDGLRGFASLYVIVAHLFPLLRGSGTGERVLRSFIDLGWSGVDLFFVLSGFLITGILLKSKEASAGRYFGVFYARRFLRVFPVYYSLLVFFLVIVPRISFFGRTNYFWVVPGSSFPYWTYLSNWRDQLNAGTHSVLCVCWSLSIEEQYYLVWPLIVWCTNRRRLAVISLALFASSALLRSTLFFMAGYPADVVYRMTFTHLEGIALGSAIAVAWQDRERYRLVLQRLARLALPLGSALLVLVAYAGLKRGKGEDISYTPTMILAFPLIALFWGSIVIRSLTMDGIVKSIFTTRFLRLLGKYSYAAYLFQFAAAWFVDNVVVLQAHKRLPALPQLTGPAGLFSKFVLQVMATYGLAALSWKILEGPINAFKDSVPLLNPHLVRYAPGRLSPAANAWLRYRRGIGPRPAFFAPPHPEAPLVEEPRADSRGARSP